MKNKKILLIAAIAILAVVLTTAFTACNTEEKIYEQIFSVCAKQNDLAVTVKQGDVTVYTYADGVGSSDFEDLDVDAGAYIEVGKNAGKTLTLDDLASDVKRSYEEVTGEFEIEGKLANAKKLLGIDVTANIHLKGNYITGKVEIYEVTYVHNGFDVTITLV